MPRGLWTHARVMWLALLVASPATAQSGYYRHVVFDNGQQTGGYWSSNAVATPPSTLEQSHARLPVESAIFHTPPNALRLAWLSRAGGSWDAEVHVASFPNRPPRLDGANLFIWIYSPDGIAADDLPDLILSDVREGLRVAAAPGSFTASAALGQFAGDVPAGRWVQVRIPMAKLRSGSVYEFRPDLLQNVIFHQGRPDGAPHTLLVDDRRVDDDPDSNAPPPSAPVNLEARAYERHIALRWDAAETTEPQRYLVYRSVDGGRSFHPIGIQAAEHAAIRTSSAGRASMRRTG